MTERRPDVSFGDREERYGIVGFPLAHTASPAMQNAAFAALGLPATYLRFPLPADSFEEGARALFRSGVRGLNVTVPFKERAFALVDEPDQTAQRCGSVNTIRNDGGTLRGTSTDGAGFLADLACAGLRPEGARVLCLGGGGAARAIVAALIGRGAGETRVAVRSPGRAAWVAGLGATLLPFEELARGGAPWEVDCVVQTTPLGSDGLSAPAFEWDRISPATLVYDIVYEPARTPFLLQAEARGCSTRNGLGMLVFQGASSFRFFTGHEAPIERMARAVGWLGP